MSKESFEEWTNDNKAFGMWPFNLGETQASRQAWDYQQKKIDALEEENFELKTKLDQSRKSRKNDNEYLNNCIAQSEDAGDELQKENERKTDFITAYDSFLTEKALEAEFEKEYKEGE